jgi:hypothetical protein
MKSTSYSLRAALPFEFAAKAAAASSLKLARLAL